MHHPLKAIQLVEAESNEWAQPANKTTKKSLFLYASFDFIWSSSQFSYTFMWSIDGFFCRLLAGAMGNNAVPQSTVIQAYVCEIRYAKIVFCALLNIRVFFCGVRPPSNFQLSTFCFRQRKDTVPHISILFARAFTWLVKKTLSMILCVHDGLAEKCTAHTCASYKFSPSNFNGMKQFYWNLILEMMMMLMVEEETHLKYIQHFVDATEKRARSERRKKRRKSFCVNGNKKRQTETRNLSLIMYKLTRTHIFTGRALTVNCVYCIHYNSKEKTDFYRANTEKNTHKNVENQERKKSKTEFLSSILHTHTHCMHARSLCVCERGKQPSIY